MVSREMCCVELWRSEVGAMCLPKLGWHGKISLLVTCEFFLSDFLYRRLFKKRHFSLHDPS